MDKKLKVILDFRITSLLQTAKTLPVPSISEIIIVFLPTEDSTGITHLYLTEIGSQCISLHQSFSVVPC